MQAFRLLDGSMLRYLDMPGTARPIVFIHGLGCASSSDYPIVARSDSLVSKRAILIDLLGFGFSDKPDAFSYTIAEHARTVCDLVDRLGLQDFDLFGHSMGGAVAITVAARILERVHSLVLSEPNLDSGGGVFSRAIQEQLVDHYVRAGHAATIKGAADSGNSIWAGMLQVASALAVHRSATSLVQGTMPS